MCDVTSGSTCARPVTLLHLVRADHVISAVLAQVIRKEVGNLPDPTDQPYLPHLPHLPYLPYLPHQPYQCEWESGMPSRPIVSDSKSISMSTAGSLPTTQPSCPGSIATTSGAANS